MAEILKKLRKQAEDRRRIREVDPFHYFFTDALKHTTGVTAGAYLGGLLADHIAFSPDVIKPLFDLGPIQIDPMGAGIALALGGVTGVLTFGFASLWKDL